VTGSANTYPGGVLAKQIVTKEDTVIGQVRYVTYTIYVDDTLTFQDTNLIPDTSYFDEVLVRNDTTLDTSLSVDSADTTYIVLRSYGVDSVHVVDTVVSTDTLVSVDTLFILDTIVWHDTFSVEDTLVAPMTVWSDSLIGGADYLFVAGAPSSVNTVDCVTLVMAASDTAPVIVVDRAASSEQYLVDPTNYSIDRSEITVSIDKELDNTAGVTVSESYGDLDGDSTIFGVGSQVVRYSHLYMDSTATVSARVDFGPGVDGSFTTTRDNTILSLVKDAIRDYRHQNVSYRCLNGGGGLDTVWLDIEDVRHDPDSTLEFYRRSYLMFRGNNDAVGNDDLAASWTAVAEFRSGAVRKVEIALVLPGTVARGLIPTTGTVEATIWLSDGSVGRLEGALMNFATGVLWGEDAYRKDGYYFDVDVDATRVVWEWRM
jgi:hypothetical protein